MNNNTTISLFSKIVLGFIQQLAPEARVVGNHIDVIEIAVVKDKYSSIILVFENYIACVGMSDLEFSWSDPDLVASLQEWVPIQVADGGRTNRVRWL